MKRGTTAFVLEENVDKLTNQPFNSTQYEEFFSECETDGLINYILETAEAHRQTMLLDVSDVIKSQLHYAYPGGSAFIINY